MSQSREAIALGIALRARIIAVLSACPGGLTSAELSGHFPDVRPEKIIQLAGKLRDQHLLKSDRALVNTRIGALRIGARWFVADQPKPRRTNFHTVQEKTDGPGVYPEDQEWHRFWHPSNRAERRGKTRPGYIPVPQSSEAGYRLHEIL